MLLQLVSRSAQHFMRYDVADFNQLVSAKVRALSFLLFGLGPRVPTTNRTYNFSLSLYANSCAAVSLRLVQVPLNRLSNFVIRDDVTFLSGDLCWNRHEHLALEAFTASQSW